MDHLKVAKNRKLKTKRIPDSLKCVICGYYLSVPPISIFNKGHTCGRCIPNPHEKIDPAYEYLAQFFKFPCRNSHLGCKKFFNFGNSHETDCDFKGIICFAPNCTEIVGSKTILLHFERNHSSLIINSNCFYISHKRNILLTRLVLLEQMPFILQIKPNELFNCKVALSTLCPRFVGSNYAIEVTADSANSLILRQKISKFGLLENNNNSISFGFYLIKNLRNYPQCNFTISLTDCFDKQPEASSSKQPETTILSNPTKSKKFDKENANKNSQIDNSHAAIDVVVSQLECVVCSEYMIPPIFICKIGHSICSDCRKKLLKCPSCQADYEGTRNFVLEKLAEDLWELNEKKDKTNDHKLNPGIQIKNLNSLTTELDLEELVKPFGMLKKRFLAKDKKTGLCKGFAFVHYKFKCDAEKAIQFLNGQNFHNSVIEVNWAKSRA